MKKKKVSKVVKKVKEIIKSTKLVNKKLYETTDIKLVEKLQEKFNVKDISVDREVTGESTFTFDATEKEVKEYLKEL